MNTKYGHISPTSFKKYQDSLISRIWVLLPLKEESCSTLREKIERLCRELHGMLESNSQHSDYIITVMHLLENLITEDDFSAYRSDVLRCCELVKKFGGDEINV